MRHVGQQVARHDAPVRYAERACGLHVFQFPQLQRFRAHQAAQPRPTGQAKNHAKQEQPQVRARDRGVEQVGVVVDIDLHHQRASRHQQHAGNRGNGGVQMMAGGSMAMVVRLPMTSAVRMLFSACHSTSLPMRSVPSAW
ncbi:hypothetical protein G6F31_020176 [Rhizopus arrhizus]|nr:hypothetical protein G6F31_020176 [Rhizopus arrhizus]